MRRGLIRLPWWISLPIALYAFARSVSESFANFCLCALIVLVVVYLLCQPIFIENTYKNSIKNVDKRYVFNNYTIRNNYCTVRYTPDDKITVIDNVSTTQKRDLRTFTVTKANDKTINKTWSQICKVFDEYSSVDSLAAFVGLYVDVNVVLIPTSNKRKDEPKKEDNSIRINASNLGPKIVDMDDVKPDPYSAGTEHARKTDDNFVNLDSVQKSQPVVERKQGDSPLVDFGDALSAGPNKINVNTANAAELAVLPGINIVMAKKIVEFRDTTRMFDSVDDFIANSGVKQHFEAKIKSMIVAEKPSVKKGNDDSDAGRIVDI